MFVFVLGGGLGGALGVDGGWLPVPTRPQYCDPASLVEFFLHMFVCFVWMGVGCPCPPVRVTCYVFELFELTAPAPAHCSCSLVTFTAPAHSYETGVAVYPRISGLIV